jgi:sigma-E factor negative regulatory protein RseA
MTLGGSSSDPMQPYRVHGYRALDNGDGSYLLLIDPSQAANGGRRPQAAVAQ